jgi:RimJ/RimL family protein N-acetyltransferase
MSFSVRFGFLPIGERLVATVGTAEITDPGPPPGGLRAITLDRLPSLSMLLDTYNLATSGDPDSLTVPLTLKELRQGWWSSPDNASDLSWGLVADSPSAPLLTSFCSTTLDRERGRAWSAMTATDPSYRRRGLASWVKRRSLRSLHEAGVAEASTTVDAGNTAMATLNQALGYRPSGVFVHMGRRVAR